MYAVFQHMFIFTWLIQLIQSITGSSLSKCGYRHVWYFQGLRWRNSGGRSVRDTTELILTSWPDMRSGSFVLYLHQRRLWSILTTLTCFSVWSCSSGCVWEVGGHSSPAAQAHEGGCQEAKEQRADPQHQAQEHPLSLSHSCPADYR